MPISIRVLVQEKRLLEAAAGSRPLSGHLRQRLLAEVKLGLVPAPPELELLIETACNAVFDMCRMLMQVLGLIEGGKP